MPGTDGDAEWRELTDAWHAAYWRSQEPWRHRVVTGPRPVLYDCFDHADLLISDISSVVADFIASGKPYAVANPDGLGEDEFRTEYPTAAAAYLIDPGCTALPDVLAEAAGPGPDRLAGARQELKGYLLGPDHPDALTRFNNAVETLATRAARLAGADVAPGAAAAEEGPAVRAVSGA